MTIAGLEHVRFSYDGGASWALDDVGLRIGEGERVCIVGPNGSGKSTLARVLAGLAAPDAGTVTLLGERVFDDGSGAVPEAYRRARRGIGAVFQNPEDQIVTTVVEDDVAFGPENLGVGRDGIGRRIAEALRAVDMSAFRGADPTVMSGGQQQRIAIAGTLAMAPSMIVLDEPTAMLDAAARAELMRILDALQARGVTIVLVTHHDDETARADRVIRMEGGRIVGETRHGDGGRTDGETHDEPYDGPRAGVAAGSAAGLHGMPAGRTPAAPVTAASSDATAASDDAGEPLPADDAASTDAPAVVVDHVSFSYPDAGTPVLDDVSFTVRRGETVAIMGRNGAGKSTLARLLCALERPASGSIAVCGVPTTASKRRERRALRRHIGYVMQHPERQLFADTVAQDVAYGPNNQGLPSDEVRTRVDEALRLLRIGHLADRSPFALSGGQQRLAAIAGVIACRPDVLVLDEPTASLDAAATARIHELIRTLHDRGVTVLIITHSPAEANLLADRVITVGTAADRAGTSRDDVPQDDASQDDAPRDAAPRGGAGSRRGPLSAMDPRVMMVTFLVLMFTAFAISNVWQLGLAAVMTAALIAAGRLNPLRLLSSVRLILGMLVVMGALNVFFARGGETLAEFGPVEITTGGLATAALYMLRFAMVILLGAILLDVTTPTELTDAVGSLLSPLRRLGVHTQEIALVLSLALRFLPTLARETHAIVDAQAARGGDIETGSLGGRIRALTAIVVPVFAGTLRHADNLALALDARCYEEGARRTHWRRMRVRARDLLLMGLAAAYLVALILLGCL